MRSNLVNLVLALAVGILLGTALFYLRAYREGLGSRRALEPDTKASSKAGGDSTASPWTAGR